MSAQETVVVTTRTQASTEATARTHTFVIDKLPANGGSDEGPMASEYLLGALASCQITTAHKIAAKRRQPIDAITIAATATFAGDVIDTIALDIEVRGGAGDEELETILRLTERSCTVSRALSVPVEHTVRRVG
jgi:uncharacterized OsmC-like protein